MHIIQIVRIYRNSLPASPGLFSRLIRAWAGWALENKDEPRQAVWSSVRYGMCDACDGQACMVNGSNFVSFLLINEDRGHLGSWMLLWPGEGQGC